MIKLFCKGLPYYLSNLLYSEYQIYLKEINFLVKTFSNKYSWLNDIDFEIIELILALSIFFRRIIAQLESVYSFRERVFPTDDKEASIEIGSYSFNKEESQKIEKVINQFWNICERYGIQIYLFDFSDSETFLYKLKKLMEEDYTYE